MDDMVVGCWGDLSLLSKALSALLSPYRQLILSRQQQHQPHRFVIPFPDSFKAYLRLAEVGLNAKLQMLALARAALLNPAMTSIILQESAD